MQNKQRSWEYLKENYTIEGARKKFEDACLSIFLKKHKDEKTHTIRTTQGDGGIDIYVGDYPDNVETVYQCKYFLDNFGSSQITQVKHSLLDSLTTHRYSMRNWKLCIPRVLSDKETKLFTNMKKRVLEEFDSIPLVTIDFHAGDELISLAHEHEVYDDIFEIKESQRIKEIHEVVTKNNNVISLNLRHDISNTFNIFLEKFTDDFDNKDLKYVNYLLQELSLNAKTHGFADNIELEKKANKIIFRDNGKEFNPLLSQMKGGGGVTLEIFQEEIQNIKLSYSYEEGKNIIIFEFIDSKYNIVSDDCIIKIDGNSLINKLNVYIDEIKNHHEEIDCDEMTITIQNYNLGISYIHMFITKALSSFSCPIIFRMIGVEKRFIDYFNNRETTRCKFIHID